MSTNTYQVLGNIKGEKGADGLSAYDIWLAQGNIGTESDFLESLKGSPGLNGDKGEQGVGVQKTEISNNGELEITYTDGNLVNLGKVVGEDGLDGTNGNDGYTPLKGVDYYTETDKAEIVEEVIANIEIPETDLTGYATEDYVTDAIGAIEIPKPKALTFTGAVNATYDGSKAVSVEIPSGDGAGKEISLTDKATNKKYTLYVSNGKLMLAESED